MGKGLEPRWSLVRPHQHSESPPCTSGHQQESHVAPLSPLSTAVCAARRSSALMPTWFLPSCVRPSSSSAFRGLPCSASPWDLCVPPTPAPSEPWLSLRPWFPVALFCPHPATPGLLGAVPLLTGSARPLSAHPQGHPVSGDGCAPLLHLHSPHALQLPSVLPVLCTSVHGPSRPPPCSPGPHARVSAVDPTEGAL